MLERKNLENSTHSLRRQPVLQRAPEEAPVPVREEDVESSQRYPVQEEVKAFVRAKLEAEPVRADPSRALERLREKLELRTLGNYKKVLADMGELQSSQMLKKLSLFKPQHARAAQERHAHPQLYTDEDLVEEQPLQFKGQPIARFEDLLRFVNFEVAQMPDYSLKGDEFDPALEREIRKIRTKNKASLGGLRMEDFGRSSPPIDNLILLTAIDGYLNDREAEENYFSAQKALDNVKF